MSLDLKGMTIAVLMGGPGSERKVSLKSGEGVVAALQSLGANAVPVDVILDDDAGQAQHKFLQAATRLINERGYRGASSV